jgi:hypothetical protein
MQGEMQGEMQGPKEVLDFSVLKLSAFSARSAVSIMCRRA